MGRRDCTNDRSVLGSARFYLGPLPDSHYFEVTPRPIIQG